MDLKEFLRNLHFDVDKVRPPDWHVDWEDAPLPYKLYRGLPAFPLSAEVPLTLAPDALVPDAEVDWERIGHFLWYVYGLSQFSHSALALSEQDFAALPVYTPRRFVPSGGALYPSELYTYLKIRGLPRGVYHYDAAHHRLVLLREGDFDSYLERALGRGCDLSACFGTLFVSTMYWKNFYKYCNFAARLQGLDAGVLMGQALSVAQRFGFTCAVHYQFLDRAVNHLLGLDWREETVFAVMPLSQQPAQVWLTCDRSGGECVTASGLCDQLPPLQHRHFVRSRTVKDCPALVELNQAAAWDVTEWTRWVQAKEDKEWAPSGAATVSLRATAAPEHDLAAACRARHSPGTDFIPGKVDAAQLAALLHQTLGSFVYANDLDGSQGQPASRLSLCGCLYGVEGIPDGAYVYEPARRELLCLSPGDHRHWLHQAMPLPTVNLFQVPVCLHVAGHRHHLRPFGARGYRIQQMEAGMLVQRLLLAACTLGMGGHPLLGFEALPCDQLYRLPQQGKTSLIQVPVGPYRPHPRLQGGLHA
ncbi:SagB family peptide dehydrogenase [Alicyclobacillus kakegawensis]|uniref:SagB family peptide dehydrogenase n=1 Tax=Alicyclobacillus kakegawensis TaxID=392012 RepID=UPI00082AF39A|nr:SagB family peptide dehydrogenase [Alicyclobacillus kakegawensis]